MHPALASALCRLSCALVSCALASGCAPSDQAASVSAPEATPAANAKRTDTDAEPAGSDALPDAGGSWELLYEEDFEDPEVLGPAPPWTRDGYPEDGVFSDRAVYFTAQGIAPPPAFRRAWAFGAEGWLSVEAYSRSADTAAAAQAAVVADPAGGEGRVLRLRSPRHTDAVVVRSSRPLPARYRISLRIGYAAFGDGSPASGNGYDGGESAEPWHTRDATRQNGFYWLAILDAVPRPHNNVWIHHRRKLVIDSDNHFPPWMEIYDGQGFAPSGVRPVMMFAVDGRPEAEGHALFGKPFVARAAGAWQPSGSIRAADAYRPERWYRARIERDGDGRGQARYALETAGDFAHGGDAVYRGVIDAAARCVWHFNQPGEPAPAACIDTSPYAESGSDEPRWPADAGWPDYFFFGDPHANYYEGQVFVDDVRLEVWRPAR